MDAQSIAELLKNGKINSFNTQMGKSNSSVRHIVLNYILDNFDVADTNIKSALLMFKSDLKYNNLKEDIGSNSMNNDIELYRDYIKYLSSKMKQFGLDDPGNFIQNMMDFTYKVTNKYDESILVKELDITTNIKNRYNILDCLSYIERYKS